MAVSEYSDTVLQEIHKNHEEAMFLYDMLNNKHANIKDTVSKMDKAVKAAEDKAKVKAEENVKTQKENVTEEQLTEVQEPAETIEPSGSPEIGFMGRPQKKVRTITRRFWKCTDRANLQWQLPRNWGWVSVK